MATFLKYVSQLSPVQWVKMFALPLALVTALSISFLPGMRLTASFMLVGIAVTSSLFLFIFEEQKWATHAIWLASVALIFTSTELEGINQVLCILFALLSFPLLHFSALTASKKQQAARERDHRAA